MDNQPLLHREHNRRSYIKACILIALAQFFERVSFYGIVGSMEALLRSYPLCWEHFSNINNVRLVFMGISFFTAFLFGYLADAYIQRYFVILLGFVLHIAGMIYFVILGHSLDTVHKSSTTAQISENICTVGNTTGVDLPLCYHVNGEVYCTASIYVFVVVIAIGSSAVRTNLAPFGADQVWKMCFHRKQVDQC